MGSLRDRVNETVQKGSDEGSYFTGVNNGIRDFWFPLPEGCKEYTWYGTLLSEGSIWSEHFDTGLCPDKYYPDDPEGCPSCKKDSKFKKEFKDKKTGEMKTVIPKEKPARTFRALMYLHNFAPINGEPVMRASKDGKEFPAYPLVVMKTACGEANTKLQLVEDRFITQIKEARDGGYLLEQVFEWKVVTGIDPETKKEKVIKATACRANDRAIMEVRTADGKVHKIKVKDLKVPADIMSVYGPDALIESELMGIEANTIKGVRWDHKYFDGFTKPKALDQEPEETNSDQESDAEKACDD